MSPLACWQPTSNLLPFLLPTVPQDAPRITSVTLLNDLSVEVRWEGIPLNTFAGAPQGYKIVYYENTTAHAPMYQHVFAPELINTIRVGGLRNNTLYSISVVACNVFADGPPSDPVNIMTTSAKCKLRYPFEAEINNTCHAQ